MKRDPRLVFITGAGSGIGRATALRYGRMGATVIPTDINIDSAQETAERILRAGGKAEAYRLDVADPGAFEEVAEAVRLEFGVPDVVVNNAGMAVGGAFLEHSMADWKRMLDVHLMGVVHGSRLFGQQMVDRGDGGHIVNVASVAAFGPAPYASSYCTAKAAIKMLSECLRAELAPHHIGVSAMCFGLISTNIARSGELINFDPDVVATGKRLVARGMDLLGADPDKAAKAIVGAVRHNRAVVPVRPEAYAIYGITRLSPGLVRFVMTQAGRVATRENAERLVRLVPRSVTERLSTPSDENSKRKLRTS